MLLASFETGKDSRFPFAVRFVNWLESQAVSCGCSYVLKAPADWAAGDRSGTLDLTEESESANSVSSEPESIAEEMSTARSVALKVLLATALPPEPPPVSG